MDQVFRACSVCGSTQGRLVIDRAQPQHVVCKNCGFVCMAQFPDATENTMFYSNTYWKEHHNVEGKQNCINEADVNHRSRASYQTLKPFLSAKSRVLEIGCGFGHTLAYIKSQVNCEVAGIELSFEGCKNTSEVYGVQVFQGTWDAYKAEQKFDCIILNHVLEHLPDTHLALQKIALYLKPDGVFLVEVPNLLKPEKYKKLTHWFSKEHLYYFSPEKLIYFLTKNGFEIKWREEKEYIKILCRLATTSLVPKYTNEYIRVIQQLKWHDLCYYPARVAKKWFGVTIK
jgi:SAM-dependent methyltransferase